MPIDSLNSVKTRSPLRVFAVFAIGIILPSGFLSYIGLRSFRYEGAMMQKQTTEQYAAVADLMQKRISEQLADFIMPLRLLAHESAFEHLSVPDMIPLVLSKSKLNSMAVENLFVFDADDRMIVPWSSESVSVSESDPADLNWGLWTDERDRLEHLEFVDKDIAQAIKGYQALQTRHLAPTLQAELLKSIADGYRKLHEYHLAETNYLKLAREYDSLTDVSGIPTGIVARQLLIRLYDEDKAWDRAIDTRLELWEGLILRRWSIPISQQDSILRDLQRNIQNAMAAHPTAGPDRQNRWERVQAFQNRLDTLGPIGQTFARQMWPDLSKRLRLYGWVEQGGILELPGSNSSPQVAIVAPILSAENGRRRGTLVAVVAANSIWTPIEQSLLELAEPVSLGISWDHASAQLASLNRSSHALWRPSLERQVDGIDPPIHFRLSESNSLDQNRLARRRLWIYGGMVGLSFIVIVVGLVVMRQAVKREIEVANLKADFVANVSHELRTPLTTISYIGERLNLGRYRTDDERKEFYGMLDRETHRLRDLIEDILDFSKMLAGKKLYQQEPLPLAPLVQEAQERFHGKAQAKGFEVSVDLPAEEVTILGDRKVLLQAILNLLDNALKYSGQSRKIDVQLKRTADRAIIAVRDYGIGIAEAEKEKIFEKFYRVEQSLARDTEGGVGLGLAMVKHIMDGHQGRIRVESRPGEGSLFSLEFPLGQNGGPHGAHISR